MHVHCPLAWSCVLSIDGKKLLDEHTVRLSRDTSRVSHFTAAGRRTQWQRSQRRARLPALDDTGLLERVRCGLKPSSSSSSSGQPNENSKHEEWLTNSSAEVEGAQRGKGRKRTSRSRRSRAEVRLEQPLVTSDHEHVVEATSASSEEHVRSVVAESTLPQCSREFMQLCRAQFEVLASILGATQCALCVRREAPDGSLEFVPLCVHPEAQTVWVVGAAPGSRPLAGPAALPGGVAAGHLLPEYPFIYLNEDTASQLADGGLSAPLLDGNNVVGMLAVWRERGQDPPRDGRIADAERSRWSEGECKQLVSVAKTLALALILDQRHRQQQPSPARSRVRTNDPQPSYDDKGRQASRAEPAVFTPLASERADTAADGTHLEFRRLHRLDMSVPTRLSKSVSVWTGEQSQLAKSNAMDAQRAREGAMLAQVRDILGNILHQAKSPITALRTFGKLLLRRLPPGDVNRDLARDIIVQCERLNELLSPLDTVTQHVAQLPPPFESESMSKRSGAGATMSWPMRTAAIDTNPSTVPSLPPRSLLLPSSTSSSPPKMSSKRSDFGAATTPASDPGAGNIQHRRLHLCWMNDIVRPLLGTATALAIEHGVELRGRLDHVPAILADGFALREAISNVLENAIKYTGMVRPGRRGRLVYLWIQLVSLAGPGRSPVASEVSALAPARRDSTPMNDASERDQVAVALFVGDTGPGIPRRELKRIWERGYRGRRTLHGAVASSRLLSSSSTAETITNKPLNANAQTSIDDSIATLSSCSEWTPESESDSAPHGLGLYLTRQLVENMGGIVVLQSPWPHPERARDPPGISGSATDLDWAANILPQCVAPPEQMNVYVKAPPLQPANATSRRAHQRGTLVGIVFQRAISA
ncbi:hypothetical protein CCYA_CCYA05G1682 [Cyanidiococcus yangmingshanensis]|nr:hypothetical protein CCYA_CCYA05G1682 [Cyanidiococcus yangmingshanensis]